jgi:SAM-dependent methyltransferase
VRYLSACIVVLAAASGLAQTPATQEQYKPTVGQPGKDAVWVPTSEALVAKMFDMAKLTPQDFVMDLGSGDGRTIIAAAKRGARGLGVEYNQDLVDLSKRLAAEAGVSDKASFVQGDMYEADVSKATVLALFLLPSNLEKLAPKFLKLRPGTRIVANTFWIEGWPPDEMEILENGCENWCKSLLFIVPAPVEGTWRLARGELVLKQNFQMVTGTATGFQMVAGTHASDGVAATIAGKLRGADFTFTVGEAEYTATVNGDTMKGTVRSGSRTAEWSATRVREGRNN